MSVSLTPVLNYRGAESCPEMISGGIIREVILRFNGGDCDALRRRIEKVPARTYTAGNGARSGQDRPFYRQPVPQLNLQVATPEDAAKITRLLRQIGRGARGRIEMAERTIVTHERLKSEGGLRESAATIADDVDQNAERK